MASILELGGEYKTLYAMLTDAEEGEEDIINDTLECIMGEIEVKGENYINLCDRLDMEIDACKKHVAYWQNELRLRENGLKRLKDRLVQFLLMIGKKEIKTTTKTIKLVGNGGRKPLKFSDGITSDIPIDKIPIDKIPKEFRRVEVKEVPDTDKIRQALDSGVELDFVKYGERGSHLKF